mgnify:CR=1 FL=1
MFYKHWKKFALALTALFWAGCDDSASSSEVVLYEKPLRRKRGRVQDEYRFLYIHQIPITMVLESYILTITEIALIVIHFLGKYNVK